MNRCLLRFRVDVERDGDGYYATCPDLGCVHVFVETEDEIREAIEDAARAYLAMTIRHGDSIPDGIVVWQGSPLRLMFDWIRHHFAPQRGERFADIQMPIFQTAA